LLQGKDISTLPDTVDKLTTANHDLVQANQDLSNQLKQVNSLLDQFTRNRDGANQQSDKADQFVRTLQEQQQQIQTAVAAAENSARALTATAVAPMEATLTYGLVFSADKSKEAAMDEVNKAKSLSNGAIALYHREKSIRSVAGFPTREAAVAALPAFRAKWSGAYIVDLRT
jgi:ABC-type transporter Mla subunit MlaD